MDDWASPFDCYRVALTKREKEEQMKRKAESKGNREEDQMVPPTIPAAVADQSLVRYIDHDISIY